MTYSESAQGEMITERRAMLELKRHGAECDRDRFHAEVKPGAHGLYDAGKVVEFLGYWS